MGASESTASSNANKEEEEDSKQESNSSSGENSTSTGAVKAIATVAARAAVVGGFAWGISRMLSDNTETQETVKAIATIAAGAAFVGGFAWGISRMLSAVVGGFAWGISRMLSDNTETQEKIPQMILEAKKQRERSTWSPPPRGRFKLNTDGSSPSEDQTPGRPQKGPSGYGGILRDHDGKWVCGFIGYIGVSDGLTSELHGIWEGLKLLDKLKYKGAILENDSEQALDWVTREDGKRGKKEIVPASWDIIMECKRLAAKNQIDIKHVYRDDANRCADKLAKMALKKRLPVGECVEVNLNDIPDDLRVLVAKDAGSDVLKVLGKKPSMF